MSPDGRWYQGGACREAKQAHAGCFRQRAAVRSELCGVFATLGTFFRTATVSRVFAVPMSRVCNNKWLQQHAGGMMKSLILKRSVVLAGHKTSVSLEDTFWRSLKEIAAHQHVTLSALLASIDTDRHHGNLSSAIRLFVLNFYRDQLEVRERSERVQAMVGRSVPGYT
jgi:predicted DNA-binding ribbon-helix-helix protein